MRISHVLFYIMPAMLFFSSTAQAQTRKYELAFTDFHEVKVVDGINVVCHTDESKAGKIEFDADPSVASAVMFSPGKGKLTISLASRDTSYTNLPTVHIFASSFSSLRNEGDSTLLIVKPSPVPKLTIKLIGNGNISASDVKATELIAEIISGKGKIDLTGTASMAKLSVTGAGSIIASEVKATEASAVVTGTGTITCDVQKTLSYGGLGSGTIIYYGTPQLKKKLVNGVKIQSAVKH